MKSWDGSEWRPSDFLWRNVSETDYPKASLAAVAGVDQENSVFAVEVDGAISRNFWNATTSWGPGWDHRLDGTLMSAPALVSFAPNRTHIFGPGAQNAMYHRVWQSDLAPPWENLGGSFDTSPAVAAWGNNGLDIFAVGTDHAMYHRTWNGSAWLPPSSWENLGGVFIGPPAAAAGPNALHVFGLGNDGKMYHKTWNGTSWQPSATWEDLGGPFVAP
jgi:serine protease AprX